jgi:hypothetical protein
MKCVLCNRTIQYAKDDNVAICVNCFVKIISMGWREPIKDKKYADAVNEIREYNAIGSEITQSRKRRER